MGLKGSENYIWWEKDELGKGATASVYKCRNKKTGEVYAVKVFSRGVHSKPSIQLRELELLGKLKHENIVRLLAIEEESPATTSPPSKVIIMEYCNGGSLYAILDEPSNAYGLEETEFLLFLKHICEGMKYLFEQKIVHRDIKPGNIMKMINNNGQSIYKLTDFGAARELETEEECFMSLHGTEEYLHPDLYYKAVEKRPSSSSGFTSSVDLWSVGVTIYHVATGNLPFRPQGGRRNKDGMAKILRGKKKGQISGIQDSDYNITYDNKLPNTCNISEGLKQQITPILASILDTDDCWPFEQFFREVKLVFSKIAVTVFDAYNCSAIKIYCDESLRIEDFKKYISEQTKIPHSEQLFIFGNNVLEDLLPPSKTVKDFPPTSDEHPIFVYHSTENLSSVEIPYLDLPKFPRFGSQFNLESDYSLAKNCSGIMFVIERTVISFLIRQRLLDQAVTYYENYIVRNVLKFQDKLELTAPTAEQVKDRFQFMKELVMMPSLKQTQPSFLHKVPYLQERCDEVTRSVGELRKHSKEYKDKLVSRRELSQKWKRPSGCESACLTKVKYLTELVHQCYKEFLSDRRSKQLPYNEEQIHKFEKNKMSENCVNAMSLVEQHCYANLKKQSQLYQQWYTMSCKIFFKCGKLDAKLERIENSFRDLSNELNRHQLDLRKDISQLGTTVIRSQPSSRPTSMSSSGYGSLISELENLSMQTYNELQDLNTSGQEIGPALERQIQRIQETRREY